MKETDPKKELIDGAASLIPEVYKDLAKPTISEIGNVTGRSVKALLSPLRGFLWGWERIEKFIEEHVNEKLKDIPEERRKSPEPEIAVPLIQSLQYTAQNETLREMYVNLLANSMDTEKDKIVHPSFVDIIKKMNTLDAKVFEKLTKQGSINQKVINPIIALKGKGKGLTNVIPEWYLGWTIDGYNEFDISSSIVRLNKFGLIELRFDKSLKNTDYEELINTPFLNDILNQERHNHPDLELELEKMDSYLYINEYGMQFKKAIQ